MSGAELTVGRVMAVKAMNMVSDATVDTVVYAYHSNKYDKDFTGGDIVKTWGKKCGNIVCYAVCWRWEVVVKGGE